MAISREIGGSFSAVWRATFGIIFMGIAVFGCGFCVGRNSVTNSYSEKATTIPASSTPDLFEDETPQTPIKLPTPRVKRTVVPASSTPDLFGDETPKDLNTPLPKDLNTPLPEK